MAQKGVKRSLTTGPAPSALLMEVKRAHVPEYLRVGAFYLALSDEDDVDELLPVPGDSMKPDTTVANSEELVHLLKSLRFWGVDGIVSDVVDFIMAHPRVDRLKSSLAAFECDYPYLYTLRKIAKNPSHEVMMVVLEVGDLALVKYFHTHPQSATLCKDRKWYINKAASHGHVDCLAYLHEQGYVWGTCNERGPIASGQTTIGQNIVAAAIMGGSVECVKYVETHYPRFADRILALYDNRKFTDDMLDCLVYAFQHTDGSVRLDYAVINGGLKSLQYCVTRGLRIDTQLMCACVQAERLDCVKYLHSVGCPWDARVPPHAATKGCFDILKYLHKNGCPWDSSTTRAAARENWLQCLKYAHKHGCPWDNSAYFYVDRRSDCYKYLERHGCPKL